MGCLREYVNLENSYSKIVPKFFRIINAKYSAQEQEVILSISDDTYSQLLLSDLATLRKEPKMPIIWKRLSICFVLAMRRKEPPNTGKLIIRVKNYKNGKSLPFPCPHPSINCLIKFLEGSFW
jgi:hypothetical protein